MGRKRTVILLLPFGLVIFISACFTVLRRPVPVVTNIVLTDNSLIIEVERRDARFSFFSTIDLHFHNIPAIISFDVQIEETSELTTTLTADLTGVPRVVFYEGMELRDERGIFKEVLYIDEVAELVIWSFGARMFVNIFIKEDRVDILEQRFWHRGWW
jgi:hypothetical protein